MVLRLRNEAGEERALHFHDTRRFGRLWLLDAAGLDSLFAALGPEPLGDAFSRQDLAALLAGRHHQAEAPAAGPDAPGRPGQHLRG